MRVSPFLVCVVLSVSSWSLGCDGDPPASTDIGDSNVSDARGDTGDSDAPPEVFDPEPAVSAWLGTRELGASDHDSFYGAVAMPGGDVVVVGASATPGAGAEGSRWIVRRLTSSGKTRWQSGGHTGAATRGVAGPDDSVIVVGQYNVARYDADGSERWHALDQFWVNDVAIDSQGRVVVGGLRTGGTAPPDDTVRPAIGTLGGTYNGFVVRLDPEDGRVLDRVDVGMEDTDWVNGLAIGPEGGIYITGPTDGTFPLATHVGDDGNSYVMRLTPDLALDWAVQPSGGFDQGYAIRIDPETAQLAVIMGHGRALTRIDAVTGAVLSNIYVADVAGSDLAIDGQGRVWFVGSTHQGPGFGMVTVIDKDDHVADPLWFADSPAQGISTSRALRGSSDVHAYGVAVDSAGFAWVVGDALGDLEQGRNVATLAEGNTVDPNSDGIVARITPQLRRDRPRFIVEGAGTPLAVGQSASLTVRVEDGSGHPIDVPAGSLVWSSALPEVASVSGDGVVTAHSGGRTRIEVALGPAHSEPLEVIVKDPNEPQRGSVLFIGADHADIATVVVPDPLATGDPGAVLVAGWTDGALARRPTALSGLADYDAMHGTRDIFIAEVAGDGTLGGVIQLGGADYDSIKQLVALADGSLLLFGVMGYPHGTNAARAVVTRIDRDGSERWHFPSDNWTATESFALLSVSVMPSGHLLVSGQKDSLLIAELDPDTGLELWRWVAEGHVKGGAGGVSMRQAGVSPAGTFVLIGDDSPPWRTWVLGLDPAATEPIHGGPKVLFYSNGGAQVGLRPGPLAMAPAGAASSEFATVSWLGLSVNQDGSEHARVRSSEILRFAADGKTRWQRGPDSGNGTDQLTATALVIDDAGNTYLAGSRELAQSDTVAKQRNAFDAFVAKLDPDGATLWYRTIGGPANDYAQGITLTPNGDVTVVGYTFGPIDSTSLHGASGKENCDAFLVRLSPDGERR